MSNEFKHKALPWDTKLNRKRWEGFEAHEADGETADDLIYFDGTYWKRTATLPATAEADIDHGTISGLADDDHSQYLLVANIDDAAVNGQTAEPISSNWAFDHDADASAHHTKSAVVWLANYATISQDTNRTVTLDWTTYDGTGDTSSTATALIIWTRTKLDSYGAGLVYVGFRKYNVAGTFLYLYAAYVAGEYRANQFIVGCDSSQRIEYTINISDTAQVDTDIFLVGYFT